MEAILEQSFSMPEAVVKGKLRPRRFPADDPD
jgi:hypothetical protein